MKRLSSALLCFVLIVLLTHCENDLLDHREIKSKPIVIEKNFSELSLDLKFKEAFDTTVGKINRRRAQKSSSNENIYDFKIDSSRIKEVIDGDDVSYSMLINRSTKSPNSFENLVIEVQSDDVISAYIIKYTPTRMDAHEFHDSFSFEGKIELHPIDYNRIGQDNTKGLFCWNVSTVYCDELGQGDSGTFYTGRHAANSDCNNPDYLTTVVETTCVPTYEYIDAGPSGDGGGLTGGGDTPDGDITTSPLAPCDSGGGLSSGDGDCIDFSNVNTVNEINAILGGDLETGELSFLFQKANIADQIRQYLGSNLSISGNYPIATILFVHSAIDFLILNDGINFLEYVNWFSSDYPDIEVNPIEVDPENITYESPFFQTLLPSKEDFINHFPKLGSEGSYLPMSSPQVYELVGGSLYNSHLNNLAAYSNACAIRGSRALIYSGIDIPVINYNGNQRTQKGGDNKNYILDAVTFDKFMDDKFGSATHELSGSDANNPTKVANMLKGKTGIYVIINSSTAQAGYSGHVDAIINGICIGGAYTDPSGGVKTIKIWVLN